MAGKLSSMDLAIKIVGHYSGLEKRQGIWDNTEVTPYSMFKNYQEGRQKGLRLTSFGWHLMRNDFTHYSFQLPAQFRLTAGHLIGLQSHCEWPYYIGAGYLRLFGEADYLEVRLVNNDIVLWLNGLSTLGQGKI